MQIGIPVARIELLDALQMDACIRYSKLEGFAARPTLLFEFHGSEAGVREQAETMQAITAEHGGSAFQWATLPEDRSRLWKARHNAYYAALALAPGKQAFSTDACVPISRLADCLLETRAELDREGVDRADRRPCRRRQFPRAGAVRPGEPGRAREGRCHRAQRQHARDRDGRHLHRRARHRRAQARSARRGARRGGATSCRRSSARSIRSTS